MNEPNNNQNITSNNESVEEPNKTPVIEINDDKPKQEEISDKVIKVAENIVNTEDKTSTFETSDIKANKMNALFCYLGPLVLMPILNKNHKKSAYVKFHVNEGVNLIILYVIVYVISGILTSMFKEVYAYSSYVPGWVNFIKYILYLGALAINLFGLFNTYNGKSKVLPIIGNFKFIK